jgi:hypothetical protein
MIEATASMFTGGRAILLEGWPGFPNAAINCQVAKNVQTAARRL